MNELPFDHSAENGPHYKAMIEEYDRLNENAFEIARTILTNPDFITVQDAETNYRDSVNELGMQMEDITHSLLTTNKIDEWVLFIETTERTRHMSMIELGYAGQTHTTPEAELRQQAEKYIENISDRVVRSLAPERDIINLDSLAIDETSDEYGELALYRHTGNLIEDMYRLIEQNEDSDPVEMAESFLKSLHINRADQLPKIEINKSFHDIMHPRIDAQKLFTLSYAMQVREKREPMGPVSASLAKLESARSDFLARRRSINYGTSAAQKEKLTKKMLRQVENMNSALEDTLDAIAANNSPDYAVPMIINLLKEHDNHLCGSLGVAAQKDRDQWMKKTSEDLLRDYAMSYADPEGLTLALSDADTRTFIYMERSEIIDSLNDKLYLQLSEDLQFVPKDYHRMRKEQAEAKNIDPKAFIVGGAVVAITYAWKRITKRHGDH